MKLAIVADIKAKPKSIEQHQAECCVDEINHLATEFKLEESCRNKRAIAMLIRQQREKLQTLYTLIHAL